MGTITSAIVNSFKTEQWMGAHCFGSTVTPTGNLTSGSPTVASVSSMIGVAVGMGIAGTGVAVGATVAGPNPSGGASLTMSANATANGTGTTLTISGDVFKLALIKHSPTNSYGAANVNYSDLTGASDEASGTNYVAGGAALTNQSPALSGSTVWLTFSGTVTWANVTVDADGAMLYNTAARLGGTSGTNTQGANRAVATFAFPGEEKVTAGTLTITLPSTSPGLLSAT